jgi:peptidoglycan/LPS O-acetylase OafA/YrhL
MLRSGTLTLPECQTVTAAPLHRYLTLDAIRGIAALAIVLLHANALFGFSTPPFTSGGYAVDMFFLMSGFVIAANYDRKFATGLGALHFMAIRVIRFYPLYLLALLTALASSWLYIALHTDTAAWDRRALNISTLFSVFMLPTIGTPQATILNDLHFNFLFPLNGPAWSLFFELLINLLYAACFRLLSNRVLIYTSLVMLVLLYINASEGSLTGGFCWANVLTGAPRVVFPFFLGVLVFRYQPALRRWSWPQHSGAVAGLTLLTLLACFGLTPTSQAMGLYGLLLVVIVFPVLLILAANHQPRHSGSAALCTFLGIISYAIYVLHVPLLALIEQLRPLAGDRYTGISAPRDGLAFLALLTGMAWLLDKYFDVPLRARLNRRLRSLTATRPTDRVSE